MAAWKRKGGLGPFHERLVGRMVEKGYDREYAERIFKQIQGFGEYGFPESHAAGFALLAYVSSWIKCHHPDAFLAGLLNSQPMGFYAPAQLVRDARAHGVEVRPVDVTVSDWESTLEGEPRRRQATPRGAAGEACASRCGSASTASSGLVEDAGKRIVAARAEAPSPTSKTWRAAPRLDAHDLAALAAGRCPAGLTGHRHQAAWAVAGIDTRPTEMLRATRVARGARSRCAAPSEGEDTLADYRALGLTLKPPSARLLREQLAAFRSQPAARAAHVPARPAGARERPRHAPAAARDRQGHGLRHARRRDRRGQRHRLAADRRGAAQAAARRDAAHRLRPVAAPRRATRR